MIRLQELELVFRHTHEWMDELTDGRTDVMFEIVFLIRTQKIEMFLHHSIDQLNSLVFFLFLFTIRQKRMNEKQQYVLAQHTGLNQCIP